MPDTARELRQRASECIALARKAILPEVRLGLLIMARNLYRMADMGETETERLDYAVRAFNDAEMTRH